MTELRAPDPTLDALLPTDVVYLALDDDGSWGSLPLVHAHRKHAGGWWQAVQPRHARWFAVPCRECFPDAPPPGHHPNSHPNHPSPGLAWQVTE